MARYCTRGGREQAWYNATVIAGHAGDDSDAGGGSAEDKDEDDEVLGDDSEAAGGLALPRSAWGLCTFRWVLVLPHGARIVVCRRWR